MSSGRSMRIPLATLLVVAVVLLHSADGQDKCGFPSAWQYTWWRYNEPATNSRVFRRYMIDSERNIRQVGTAAMDVFNTYTCEEEKDVQPFMYYVRRLATNIAVEDCVKGYSDSPDRINAQLLVVRSVSTGTTGSTATACAARTDLSLPVDVFVRYPFDFSSRVCPFPSGRYQVALSTVSSGQSSCFNDRFSYLTVTDGTVTFQTCLNGNTYESPFQNTELECVGSLAPSFIISPPENGNVIILAHTTSASVTNFYTARYQITSTGAVLMSLQGSTSGRLQPNPTKKFDTVGVVNSDFDYSYLMIPSNCNNVQCENNAVCVDVTDGGEINFLCDCDPGFSGRFCETDVDDCLAADCSGNGVCTDMVNGYSCTCEAGYGGTDCETTDYCASTPCGVNGVCTNGATTFQCICDVGYFGLNCETRRFCYNDPCQNGGICNEGATGYTCSCQGGFTGPTCATVLYCYTSPCIFGSCEEGANTYSCICQVGYTGRICDQVMPCYNSPCRNGGLCTENGVNFLCDCQNGFEDATCSTVVRCYDNGCLNGATCRETATAYSCQCPEGYIGWNCGSQLHCSKLPCMNGGRCIEESNTYSCTCPEGWTGYNCDTPDLCSALPCRNGATCIEQNGGIFCNCMAGFSGPFCELQSGCSNLPCLNGGQCIDLGNTDYTCQCASGWGGMNCQTPIGSDSCESNNCQNGAACFPRDNGYVCGCLDGYAGPLCEDDMCAPNPCDNGGTCRRASTSLYPEGYNCLCTSEFGGPTCVLDGGCNGQPCVNGQCEDQGGNPQCICADGWDGLLCDVEASDFDWTVLIVILVVLLVLVFVVLAILVCVCCVMRNRDRTSGGPQESKPMPGPVTPAGPVVREVIIPPQQVQVISVPQKPQTQQQQQQQQQQLQMVATRAMFMSDNPQKVYNVSNPLDYQYAPPAQPIYNRVPGPQVQYVAALEPPGALQQPQQPTQTGPRDIDVGFYPDVEANDYLKFGANALTGSNS